MFVKIYNFFSIFGDNFNISTKKLVELIASYLDKRAILFYCPIFIVKICLRLVGRSNIFNKIMGDFIVNNKEFIDDTGWKPPYNYKYGIKKTCLWYKRTFRMK